MRPQAHVASGRMVWSLSDGPLIEAPLDASPRTFRTSIGPSRRASGPSHSAVFWALPTLVALKTGKGRRQVGLVWIHLVMDTYADGIAWLWPVEHSKLGLFRKPPEIHDDGWNTPAPLSSELGKIELAMWVVTPRPWCGASRGDDCQDRPMEADERGRTGASCSPRARRWARRWRSARPRPRPRRRPSARSTSRSRRRRRVAGLDGAGRGEPAPRGGNRAARGGLRRLPERPAAGRVRGRPALRRRRDRARRSPRSAPRPGVVLRRVGPRAYYAAIYDAEAGVLTIVRRDGDRLDELARGAAPRRARAAARRRRVRLTLRARRAGGRRG